MCIHSIIILLYIFTHLSQALQFYWHKFLLKISYFFLVSKPTAAAKPAPAPANRSVNASKTSTGVVNNVTNQQIEDLSNQLMDMRLNLEGLEKERDFYFSKLRDIEIL